MNKQRLAIAIAATTALYAGISLNAQDLDNIEEVVVVGSKASLISAVDKVTIFLGNKSLISFNLPLFFVPISNFSFFFFNI